MTTNNQILIATNNQHKLYEIRNKLEPLGLEVFSLSDKGIEIDIEETGKTFHQNAEIKSKTIYDFVKMPVLSDDSGLIVEYLGDRPGVYSARYAGEDANDQDNIDKLLDELQGVPKDNRTAYFVAVMCLINSSGKYFFEGRCSGEIIASPKGSNGFGYDPVFYIEELNKTMAELTIEEKNDISHRAKAIQNLVEFLTKD